MADLCSILGGPWSPPHEKSVDPPEIQLRQAMLDAGLDPPDSITLDGKVRRFRSGTKGKGGAGDRSGWYVGYSDGIPAGQFGDWRTDIVQSWRADVGRQLSAAEEIAHVRRMAEARAAREAELKRQHETASDTVESIWVGAMAASPDHQYLKRKGINTNGARVTGDGRLVVPLYDTDGIISSLQYIAANGEKRYHPGGATGGRFWMIGTMDEPGPCYIAEGFATAATIHEATARPCAVAYSASNLVPVTKALRDLYGTTQDLVIVADNDASQVGQRYAEQASAKYGARYVMPPELGDANDYAQAGHDLRALLEPERDDWLISAEEFCKQPAPIAWVIKHWIQRNALVMVHGPSGGGKTFVVLDWMLHIASGSTQWCGHRVTGGIVAYLAGEGHHGLRGRIKAWMTRHDKRRLKMWLSKSGCDLNTAEGYRRAVEHLRALSERPNVIVVDTLHRFLAGDENSAQDAKTMLDACSALMHEFGCTVILVHHTGVSDEAQHRARGSSAWRGALDIEISVVPPRGDEPIELIQRKSKDAEIAEPIYMALESVQIPGWIDEDGEQVTSAVAVQADAPEKREKSDNKLDKHRQTLRAAWFASGSEVRQGSPYLSRSGFQHYLENNLGLKQSSAAVYLKPSATGKPINELMLGGVIENFENGWIVADKDMASQWMIARNSK